MYVIDEATGKIVPEEKCIEVVVGYCSDQIIFGYVNSKELFISVVYNTPNGTRKYLSYEPAIKDIILFSKTSGNYFCKYNYTQETILRETNILGNGSFPYISFSKKYEAIDNFKIFNKKQKVLEVSSFKLANELNYTFGLEFETSQGYIPEPLCFRDGLIPLRDGSISGLEYSTIILEGNEGLSLLKQQVDTLKEYTNFNKECSLHIHFGNFPLDPDKIFRVCKICKLLENSISNITPYYTFSTHNYKENKKDYCNRLPMYRNFNQMYEHLVGVKFFGSFTQPHPKDLNREAKWHINTRYFWVNFINILCYKVNKTIEFRLLRPTYNFNKIILWMYIFNAILKYAESDKKLLNIIDISDIIYSIYDTNLANDLITGIIKLKILKQNQEINNDYCGQDISLENKLFDSVSYI